MRIPRVDATIDAIAEQSPMYLTKLDMQQGYFQLGLDEDSIYKTAFVTDRGKFAFLRMPMGLAGSGSGRHFFWHFVSLSAGVS